MSIRKKILNILFWSVISAAFIGPGTITTAANAGSRFGFSLIWTLVFSTLACLVLQEAAARITIVTGINLGEAIARQTGGAAGHRSLPWLVAGSIIFGCAAFEAGNILGAVAGVALLSSLPVWIFVVLITAFAGLALGIPSLRILARAMGILVAVMGLAFFSTALMLKPELGPLIRGSLMPSIPADPFSGLLILGLIGTTVVPYNLFLGSGISTGEQGLREMRTGLSVAIVLGGLISISVLVVGTSLDGSFSFQALSESLSDRLGVWAGVLFGLGLFAAGFSSSITAPLAASITASGLFGKNKVEKWTPGSLSYRAVWAAVLATGFLFGISGAAPVPVILAAQALNGLILPFVSIFIVFVINDPALVGRDQINGTWANVLLGFVVWCTLLLGITQFLRVFIPREAFSGQVQFLFLLLVAGIASLASGWIWVRTYRKRNHYRKA